MPEKVQKWRDALIEASYLSGYESMKIRPEAKLVDVVVKDVLKKLEDITISTDSNGLVGINSRIEQVKSLLCIGLPDFRIVGIWGMGGIGKTTLVEAIFNHVSSDFDGKYFMANVREKSEKEGGLELLQKQVLSYLLEENLQKGGPNIPHYTKERLRRMKVFIVLDDVNKFGQLEYLAGGLDRFGLGSRIIVTTRDRSVLDKYGVEIIYEVEKLKNNKAVELFCNYAFRQHPRPRELMVLSQSVVDYSKGNPLALKVLGSSFYRKSKADWEASLHNLNQISDPDVYNVLKISYNELKPELQSIFLDIACFFEGEDKEDVTKLLDNPFVHYGINILIDKSLITLPCKKLKMHDLLKEMGREIVRQESVKEPGKRSRLWYHEDVYHVLKKDKGTDSIEGIFLNVSKIRDLHLTSGAFAKLSNLRLLKFYAFENFDIPNVNSKVHLPQGLNYLSDELRYLHWHGYPLRTLPASFSPENLIELSLPYSKIEQLWEGKKEAFKLKGIDLDHSPYLTRIPDSSEFPNLEKINLRNCMNLPYIPSDINNFNNLCLLCLKHCKSLDCFPANIHFSSPITIDLSFCVSLTKFPQISGNLIDLNLRGTNIEEVPSSVEILTELRKLNMMNCTRLKSISTSICKLKSLCLLYLNYCSDLESFPEILERMESLECINLSSTKIKELPSSIEHLEGLTELSLIECSELGSLPENLRNLKSLKRIYGWRSAISQLPSSITDLTELEKISFSGCRGLVLAPLSGLSTLTELDLSDCDIVEIPEDIGCLSSLEILELRGNNFESLPTSMKQLSRLRSLHLSNCNMLQSLPELPLRLESLDAKNCKLLQSLPDIPSCLEELDASLLKIPFQRSNQFQRAQVEFRFNNCPKLNEKANKKIFADSQLRLQHMAIASLKLFHFYQKEFAEPPATSICFPGSGIPDWFNQSSGSSMTIQLPQHYYKRKLIGFALCAVIGFEEDSRASGQYFKVKCSCHFEIKTLSKIERFDISCYLSKGIFIELDDHVVLGFDPCWNVSLPDGDHHTVVSFEFSIYNYRFKEIEKYYKVKCCGVGPVYANPNETQPNTFAVNMVPPTDEECTQFMKLHNDFHDKAGTSGTA